MKCEKVRAGSGGYTSTSIRYWNAFRSLNLNELPMDIVYRWIRENVVYI